jgi:MFS transporter, DHA1 family, solute carrier family 18 (vesicular amine transporter), member 1/2
MSALPPVPRRALVFWTATSLIAVDTILFTMVVPALPEYQDRYGFSDAVAALIFAAFPVGQLATALWAAGLVDRFGRRPVMILAALTLAAATLAFALASGVALIALARLVQGLAAGLVWTAALAAISDVYPQDELGFRMGLAETGGGVMGLAGPPLAGGLIAAVGLDATFFIATALPALALVPTVLVPETRRGPAAAARLLPDLRRLWAVPEARVAGVALAAAAAVLALVEPLLPLDLADRLELSSLGVGIVFAIGLAAYLLLVPIAGRWSDRRVRRTPIVVGGALMAVGLPFVAVGPAWLVTVAFSVVGAGMAAMIAPTGPLMVEAVDQAGMAGRYGLSAAALTVIFALGYVVGPLLGAASSAALPFLATTLIAAAAVVAVTAWTTRALAGTKHAAAASAPGPRGRAASRW